MDEFVMLVRDVLDGKKEKKELNALARKTGMRLKKITRR